MIDRALGVCVLGLLSGCFGLEGNGDRVTERRRVPEFSEIKNNTEFDVEVTQGDAFEVRVRIDSNLQKVVETRVIGQGLLIDSDAWVVDSVSGPHVFITMPRLASIENHGSGDVFAAWFDEEDPVSIGISGSGNLTFEGSSPWIMADVDGSGDLRLSGSTELAELTIHGSGDIDAYELTAASAGLNIEGSGELRLTVDGPVDARIHGSGDVELSGDVQPGDFSETGSGRIHVN